MTLEIADHIKSKVCFVSLNSSHLLFPDNTSFMGGAELQQFLISTELAKRGREVSFVTKAPETFQPSALQEIEVFTTFRQSAGLPVLRFIYPRAHTIIKALLRADADIYYVRGSSFILALVVLVANIKRRTVVFCGASDLDFEPKQLQLPNPRDKWMYFWGLKRVSAVIAQNETQQQLAMSNFGLSAQKIYNCYPMSSGQPEFLPEALWVGNFRDTKNPETYLALAKNIPEFKFNLIGGKPGQRDYQKIKRESESIPNLNFLGFQPLEITESYFDRVKLFVNTSEYEGFPNTFLQAWSRGLPVVSFVDPDRLIARNRLGCVVENLEEMVSCTRSILNNEITFDSGQIQGYFLKNHLVEKIADKYEALFDNITNRA